MTEHDDFLSGESGHVAGIRATVKAAARDALLDARLTLGSSGRAARRAAGPARSVTVAGIYGNDASRMTAAVAELRGSRHRSTFALGARGTAAPALAEVTLAEHLAGGKFENLNAVLAEPVYQGARPPGKRHWSESFDWLVVIDDDVVLPRAFLDRFIAICEALGLDLAQPAQTWRSHAGWRVTRRRGGSIARETGFVEIGPVTAFRREVAAKLLPFPALRYGWGLDVHWSALARESGWRLGVVDALPIRHDAAPVASGYSHEAAVAEAREFLRDKPYVPAREAQRTLAAHSRLPR